ncbi:carboxymuconolactone decarboxylase family protein [Aquabacterium humicola]|uniref:carboxymuconolactone decarboxylase family protein n=1 Tax=Aquabacterium humicola TaxID=3237377 RepID=UPI002542A8BB|nr:carboxymuconolactone decarboxylase family protein [Rubrivivax pictus]
MQSRLTSALFALVLTSVAGTAVQAQTAPAARKAAMPTIEDTYRDIQATLGLVPGFFRAYPEQGLPGAWLDFKGVQVAENTRIDPKMKQLIGLAVSAQVPCGYCVYFHTQVAKAYGATPEEIKEAVALAAISRHWSTVLNGMAIDMASFKGEVDASLRIAAERAAKK